MFRTLLFFFLSIIVSLDAQGADDPTAATPLTPRATRHGGKLGGKIPSGEKRAKARNDVRGRCTVLESPLNPISGPCVSIPLELRDTRGNSLGVARTNAQGDFSFEVDADGPFRLSPTTSYYEVVSPLAAVGRGKPLDLLIKGKN